MFQRNRREFLADVGRGVVASSIGASLASDLGFSTAFADEGPERLTFGSLEPLVGLMQETPPARLIPAVVDRLRQGTSLRDVVAAAAYANARTFGGEDYIGFHTMMAIPASYQMSADLPEARRALAGAEGPLSQRQSHPGSRAVRATRSFIRCRRRRSPKADPAPKRSAMPAGRTTSTGPRACSRPWRDPAPTTPSTAPSSPWPTAPTCTASCSRIAPGT